MVALIGDLLKTKNYFVELIGVRTDLEQRQRSGNQINHKIFSAYLFWVNDSKYSGNS